MREFLLSENFEKFEKDYPSIEKYFYIKRKGYPFIGGTYINGFVKIVPMKEKTLFEIEKDLNAMVSCFGRSYIKKMGYNVATYRNSLQGKWKENMWNLLPYHELEKREPLPDYLYDLTSLEVQRKEKFLKKDDIKFNEAETLKYREFRLLGNKDIKFGKRPKRGF